MKFLQTAIRYLCFNDVTKLCLATAVAFGIVAAAGAFANYLVPGTTHIHLLGWIGAFYLVLGLIEPLRSPRTSRSESEPTWADLQGNLPRLPQRQRGEPLKPHWV